MNFKFISLFLFSCTIGYSQVALAQERLNGYHIGNSLTWDTRPAEMVSVFESENFAASQGYHIRYGASAHYITAHPEEVSLDAPQPFGTWDNALKNFEWDYVTIQPFYFYNGTGINETEAANTFIARAIENTANLDTTFYLYAPWPRKSSTLTYSEKWNLPYSNPLSQMNMSRDFFNYWFTEVSQNNPERNIKYIPTGEVYFQLDNILQAEPVGAIDSAYDLYRDALHMGSLEGQYVAHATTLSIILQKNPSDLTFPRIAPAVSSFPGFFADVDPEFKALADQVIWSTITSDSRTGVVVSENVTVPEPDFSNLRIILIILTQTCLLTRKIKPESSK